MRVAPARHHHARRPRRSRVGSAPVDQGLDAGSVFGLGTERLFAGGMARGYLEVRKCRCSRASSEFGLTRNRCAYAETKTVRSVIPQSPGDPMSSVRTPAREEGTQRNGHTDHASVRRLATETKASFKTTEFIAFVAVLVGILVAAAVVDQADAGGLGAKQAWLYVTVLTVGYMVSRGLAKSGSSQPYDEDRS